MQGQEVCGSHGGRSGASKAAAATKLAEQELRKILGTLTVTPVENPLAELQLLAGEARAWCCRPSRRRCRRPAALEARKVAARHLRAVA
jgi:hypothetical protein